MKPRLCLAMLFVSLAVPAFAQTATTPQARQSATRSSGVDPQKAADIRRLLHLTGAGALAMQEVTSTLGTIKPLVEQSLPPGEYRAQLVNLFFEKFRSKITEEAVVALIVPVYDRHFSDEEIKQLITFYQTPLGKKASAELPKIASEVGQAGQELGGKLGKEAMQEVLAEHPDLQKALEQAEAKAAAH